MNVKASYNQALIDIALQGAGDVDLLLLTAQLNGLSITDDLVAGNDYITPDAAVEKLNLATFFNQVKNKPCSNGDDEGITGLTNYFEIQPSLTKGYLNIREGQAIIDMALQGAGDVNRFIEVAIMNGLSITDELIAGDIIYTPDALQNKKKLSLFFNAAPNYPASAETGSETHEQELHGVGYDIVEEDLVVYP